MLFRCLCLLSGAYSLGLFRALPADEYFLPLSLLVGIGFYRSTIEANPGSDTIAHALFRVLSQTSEKIVLASETEFASMVGRAAVQESAR